MVPLLKSPVEDVTLWSILSLLVHLMVVFTETVIVAGVNAVFFIQTSFGPGLVPELLEAVFFWQP